jgi:hypothetical protein
MAGAVRPAALPCFPRPCPMTGLIEGVFRPAAREARSASALRRVEGKWREIRPRPQRGTSLIVEARDSGFTTPPMMFAP